jgi:hypothetical protein
LRCGLPTTLAVWIRSGSGLQACRSRSAGLDPVWTGRKRSRSAGLEESAAGLPVWQKAQAVYSAESGIEPDWQKAQPVGPDWQKAQPVYSAESGIGLHGLAESAAKRPIRKLSRIGCFAIYFRCLSADTRQKAYLKFSFESV